MILVLDPLERAIRNWDPVTEVWLNPAAEVIEQPEKLLQTG